jgi:hypothetical protein
MQTWRQYVVFEDPANGVRLIEEHGPYGVWARLTENGPALEPVLAFERAMLQGRREANPVGEQERDAHGEAT